jgi:hypothetical protein
MRKLLGILIGSSLSVAIVVASGGCGSSSGNCGDGGTCTEGGTGGTKGAGGMKGAGGTHGSGGMKGSGGMMGSGGMKGSGGTMGSDGGDAGCPTFQDFVLNQIKTTKADSPPVAIPTCLTPDNKTVIPSSSF